MVQAVSQTFQFTGNVGGGKYDSRFLTGINVPSAPVITAAATSGSSIRITLSSYSANTNSFRLQRSPAGAGSWATISLSLVVSDFPYSVTGLSANTNYDFRLFASNAAGESPASSTVSATTSTSDPAWFRSATFESLSVGADPSSAADGFTNRIGSGAIVSTTRAYTGTKSAECAIAAGGTAFGGTINFSGIVNGSEMWCRFRCWIPSTYNITTGDGGMKFFRWRTLDSGQVPVGSNTIQLWGSGTPDGLRTEREGSIPDTRTFSIPLDQWVTFELYCKFHQTLGILRSWVDGVLRGELTGMNTSGASSWVTTQLKFLDFFNNGSPQTQSLWVDEIRIAYSGLESPTKTDSNGNIFIGAGA